MTPETRTPALRKRISVILCTNAPGEPRLVRALRSIAAQSLPMSEWEVQIVVNGSTAGLGSAALEALPGNTSISHIPDQGLLKARLKGICQTSAPLLIFVDDDNLLAPDYLENSLRLAALHPFVGVFGGRCLALTEGHPVCPIFSRALAIRDFQSTLVSREASLVHAPFGAGMVVKRDLAEKYAAVASASTWRHRLGRVGQLGGAGEDLDLAAFAVTSEYSYGLFPELQLHHWIPKRRLRLEYLSKLTRINNYGRTWVLLNYGWQNPYPLVSRGRLAIETARLWINIRLNRRMQLRSLSRRLGEWQATHDLVRGR